MSNQRVSLVTLGVVDIEASKRFYLGWGWVERQDATEVVFFQCNGLVLGLFGKDMLAADQGRPGTVLGTGAITLAQNFATEVEVDERFAAALAAGGTELKRPVKAEWGGYSGYVADPDGHVWELAVNPYWELADDGSTTIPDHLPES